MDRKQELINIFGDCQLNTDTVRQQDIPFIPNWNYDLLADILIARERDQIQKIVEPLLKHRNGDCDGKCNVWDDINISLSIADKILNNKEK